MSLDNKFVIVPIITIVICQTIKFFLDAIEHKKFRWARIFNGTGGMPSSHTSFSSSLTMLIGLSENFKGPLFAVSLIFTLIVSYDAMGIRAASGLQAEAINKMADKVYKITPKEKIEKLKEELGHQPLEVLFGYLLGIIMALVFYYYF
ncbi:MAG TPA: divergent PAP2 family protein [Tenericutes bacterium]|nr:divergent PAP2 family protein [Mycoplasmatota bacterium]